MGAADLAKTALDVKDTEKWSRRWPQLRGLQFGHFPHRNFSIVWFTENPHDPERPMAAKDAFDITALSLSDLFLELDAARTESNGWRFIKGLKSSAPRRRRRRRQWERQMAQAGDHA